MSDEEFRQALAESQRRQEADSHLPEFDPVAAEHMAYEMNPLTRADERFRVQDPTEAEHMAHAMDPHYERASAIDGLKSQTDETLGHVMQEDDDALTRKESLQESDALQGVEGSEILDWSDRAGHIHNESTALGDAASSARQAGDAHGEQVSKAYRREKK